LASLQRNGERAKPYNNFRNREPSRASRSRSRRSSHAMLLARVQDGPHTTHHSIDASDEIPEFLTSPRTSSIYTIEKVGKGSLATIVSFPEMSECDLCRPTPIGHSARHRVTAENAEVHSGSGGSVKRISQEEPTEVADMVPRNMAPPGGSFRWFRRWPTIVAASCVEVAVRFGLPGKASHFLRNIQHCFKELLRDAGIKYLGFTHRMDFLLVDIPSPKKRGETCQSRRVESAPSRRSRE